MGHHSIEFSNESLGDVVEVGRHVRDVTSGDVVFCGGVLLSFVIIIYNDFADLVLTRAAGER